MSIERNAAKIIKDLKTELQLNVVQSRYLDTKLKSIIANEKLSVLDEVKHQMNPEGFKVSGFKQEVTFKSTVLGITEELRAAIIEDAE